MKEFLNTILAAVALTGPAFCAPEKSADDVCSTKYQNRISVSPNSVSFEKLSNDSWNFGFEYFKAPALRGKNIDVTTSVTSIKVGYSLPVDCKSRFIPAIGVSMFREENTGTLFATYKPETDTTITTKITVKNPFLFHGSAGISAEYDISRTLTLGLGVHGLAGGVWGGTVEEIGDLSLGLNASLPITFRFGSGSQWDARFEPFTYLLKDYANYVGGKAALGYRF